MASFSPSNAPWMARPVGCAVIVSQKMQRAAHADYLRRSLSLPGYSIKECSPIQPLAGHQTVEKRRFSAGRAVFPRLPGIPETEKSCLTARAAGATMSAESFEHQSFYQGATAVPPGTYPAPAPEGFGSPAVAQAQGNLSRSAVVWRFAARGRGGKRSALFGRQSFEVQRSCAHGKRRPAEPGAGASV